MAELRALSLFTGLGGLDLGLEAAGFQIGGSVEIDEDAKETVRMNRPTWRLADPGDIFAYADNPKSLLDNLDLEPDGIALLSGGPPCQPFSKSSYWVNGHSTGTKDERAQTLGAYLSIVEVALPETIILENVKGFTFRGNKNGVQLLQHGLNAINQEQGTNYRLNCFQVNTADYGVPQKRERVFLVATKAGHTLSLPTPTHGEGDSKTPYLTAWDAIGALDSDEFPAHLAVSSKWANLLPSIPEGKNYLWHTERGGGEPLFGWRRRYWTFLLKLAKAKPSWTIQAQPGGATGPFHWKNRRLSIEELARLQTLPLDNGVAGDYRSAHRQIGNAVPSAIGELFGKVIMQQVFDKNISPGLTLLPERASSCPRPEPVASVPSTFLAHRGKHAPHPGTGKGPRAQAHWA